MCRYNSLTKAIKSMIVTYEKTKELVREASITEKITQKRKMHLFDQVKLHIKLNLRKALWSVRMRNRNDYWTIFRNLL